MSQDTASKRPGEGPWPPTDKEVRLDGRLGYQAATGIYMQENSVTWARFNSLVTANSIIVSATGVATGSGSKLHPLAIILPVAGLVLCWIWWHIMKRGFAYTGTWRDSAYRLERVFLARDEYSGYHVETVHQADRLRSRDKALRKAQIWIPGEDKPREHLAPDGFASSYAQRVIVLFGVVHAFAFLVVLDSVTGSMVQQALGLFLSAPPPADPDWCGSCDAARQDPSLRMSEVA